MFRRRGQRNGTASPTLFRGDGRNPVRIFIAGFQARDPTMSIRQHLAGRSGFISTTASWETARGFAVAARLNVGFGAIYTIDGATEAIRVDYKSFRHLQGEREYLFVRVPPQWILCAEAHDRAMQWRNDNGVATRVF